jgi:hypothetical protein
MAGGIVIRLLCFPLGLVIFILGLGCWFFSYAIPQFDAVLRAGSNDPVSTADQGRR